ncbi:MAG: cytochrome P450 [Pseudomonadota bacterium]
MSAEHETPSGGAALASENAPPPIARLRIGEEMVVGDWRGADPFEPNFRDDPYTALNRLREVDPVNLTPVGPWRISKFADVNQAFRAAKTSQTLSTGEAPNFDPLDRRGSFLEFMLNQDGDIHHRLRGLVQKAFRPRTVRRMEQAVEEAVDHALEAALRDGGMEVIEAMARYVPSSMICRIMGVPDEDRPKFIAWTAARTNAFFARFLPEEVRAVTRAAAEEMADYFDDMVRARRKDPQDDLVSELIAAEVEGQRLTDEEITVQSIGVITAGFETTIGLIGNGVRAFVEHPAQMAALRENPKLIGKAVNECLRFDTPVLFNWRVLEEPFVFSGRELPADSVLWLMLGSANRDPEQFADPDVFDIERRDPGLVSFGGGPHICLGNHLAKMEATHAFRALAQRTAGIEIRAEPVEWSPSFFRVMDAYRISFH